MLSLSSLPAFVRLENWRIREGQLASHRIAFVDPALKVKPTKSDVSRETTYDFAQIKGVPCFAKGSLIRTPDADIPVETLKVGDLVVTCDNGPQRIRWIGQTEKQADSRNAPIQFGIGAFGNAKPARVSPDHRILLDGWRCKKITGTEQVFARAKDLVNERDVNQILGGAVTYFHLAFDQHQVITSDGIQSESFHPDTVQPDRITNGGFDTMSRLFPGIAASPASYGPHARPEIQPFEARLIRP